MNMITGKGCRFHGTCTTDQSKMEGKWMWKWVVYVLYELWVVNGLLVCFH